MSATKQLTGSIVAKDDDERFLLGPVLVPGKADREGDVVSAENIREVAHKFTEEYQNLDLMHTFENVAKLSESFVARQDLSIGGTSIPEGSWVLGVKVEDDEVWSQVKSGELSGFSIYGQGERSSLSSSPFDVDSEALESGEGELSESKTLGKSGEESFEKSASAESEEISKDALLELDRVTFVSLVDDPAVGDSEYVVMKRNGADVPESIAKAANADDVASIEDAEDPSSERRSIPDDPVGGLSEDAPADELEKRIKCLEKKLDRAGGTASTESVESIRGPANAELVAKAREKTNEDGSLNLAESILGKRGPSEDVESSIDEYREGVRKEFRGDSSGNDISKAREGESDGRIDLAEHIEKGLPARRERKTVDAAGAVLRSGDRGSVPEQLDRIESAVEEVGSMRKGRVTGLDRELNESEEGGPLSKSNGSDAPDVWGHVQESYEKSSEQSAD